MSSSQFVSASLSLIGWIARPVMALASCSSIRTLITKGVSQMDANKGKSNTKTGEPLKPLYRGLRNPTMTDNDYITSNVLFAGRVKRYHTWSVHHEQTVGEHCWQIARIYEVVFGEIPGPVEKFIRHHDTPELITGDPPFPTKSKNPTLKAEYNLMDEAAYAKLHIAVPEISDEEKRRVKICDLLEMMEFGMVEVQMGNLLANVVIQRTRNLVKDLAQKLEDEDSRPLVHRYILHQFARHKEILRSSAEY